MPPHTRTRAILMLTLAAAAWGLSFPGGKALLLALVNALPGRTEWFYTALMISLRFTFAALLLLVFRPRSLVQLHASEVRQGVGLGVFSSRAAAANHLPLWQ